MVDRNSLDLPRPGSRQGAVVLAAVQGRAFGGRWSGQPWLPLCASASRLSGRDGRMAPQGPN